MAGRPKTTASKNEKILEAKENQETDKNVENQTVVENNENATSDETEENQETDKNAKTVKFKFTDTDDVKIISKRRAGKSITANTLNVITFDENGLATCKGLEARYLLESGLGFELAKK